VNQFPFGPSGNSTVKTSNHNMPVLVGMLTYIPLL